MKAKEKIAVSFVLCPFWDTGAPPLGITYLRSYISKEYKTFLFDFNISLYSKKKDNLMRGWDFQLPNDERDRIFNKTFFRNDGFLDGELHNWVEKILATGSEVVCFSTYSENLAMSLELAERIKQEDASMKIIFGGPFCRRNRFVYKGRGPAVVDVFVIGEGEETLLELLHSYEKKGHFDLCKGSVSKSGDGGPREPIKDLDKIPFPDFSDLPLHKYTRPNMAYLLSSRGCVGNCVFCRDRNMWPGFSYRSAENIFEEMKLRKKQGFQFLRFSDLLINGNLEVLGSLCDLIVGEGLQIKWDGAMRSNLGMDYQFFKKLKDAGFIGTNFGVESGSQRILDLMKKQQNIESFERNLRDAHSVGIGVAINIIIGFPGETELTFKETLDFIYRNREYITCLASLTPFYVEPESKLFEDHQTYNVKFGPNIHHDETDWVCLDGLNNSGWRLRKCAELYDFVKDLENIRLECPQYNKEVRQLKVKTADG